MAVSAQILLLAPDDPPRKVIADRLAAAGYGVTVIEQPGKAPFQPADLLLIADAIDNFTALLDEWRETDHDGPVVVLADSGKAARALIEQGADAALVKPVKMAALAARVESLLKKRDATPEIRFGRFHFRPPSRFLVDGDGARVRITEKEAAIIARLHASGGKPVPRDELLGEVWGYGDAVTTHTLETHIYRLRRKLVKDESPEPVVISEDGGYRLAAPI